MAQYAAGPVTSTDGHPSLDSPPPIPPDRGGRKSLMEAQKNQSLGQEAGNPTIMTMQGMQMVERGIQMLAQGLPVLEQPLAQVLAFVRQAVPQAMSGGNPMQVPAAAPPAGGLPPGVAPPMPPPQMAPAQGGM